MKGHLNGSLNYMTEDLLLPGHWMACVNILTIKLKGWKWRVLSAFGIKKQIENLHIHLKIYV